jgi:hypothetical protein
VDLPRFRMQVGGVTMPLMIQAYQKRVLTYMPDFAPEWRVQMGDVGQHYFEWRYVQIRAEYVRNQAIICYNMNRQS